MSAHLRLGSGGEFDRLRAIFAKLGTQGQSLGDDCALLRVEKATIALSIDISVENVHFRLDWLTRTQIGYRAAVASLSDLAAEGARAAGLLVSLAMPLESPPEHAAELMEGVGNAAAQAGAKVLGGDLSQAPILIVDVCAVGTAPRPVRRRGAEVGDGLWVTGRLGAMELALRELRAGRKPEPSLLARFAGPEPRLQAGQWLASQGARAMIDLSDGLSADSRHLAAASGVALEISLDRLPCWPGAAPLIAASSGEEYELLVAMPPAFGETQAQAFSGLVGTQLARIGACVDGPGGSVRFTERGVEVAAPAGYDHFTA
ncbi:MAG TPA: thiamine-phosphate kinase [Gemmatimonadales bacterium]|nr:thiamine-phosphate kinase [Gemmatimonadales bacterium]